MAAIQAVADPTTVIENEKEVLKYRKIRCGMYPEHILYSYFADQVEFHHNARVRKEVEAVEDTTASATDVNNRGDGDGDALKLFILKGYRADLARSIPGELTGMKPDDPFGKMKKDFPDLVDSMKFTEA